MNQHVPGAIVTDFEQLIEAIVLPDKDDRHVVAAAIKTRAEAIITFNLKDFPATALSPLGLEALHPDDFICNLIDINVGAVIEAARNHRAGLKNPPFSADDYLDLLLKQKLPKTVSKLRLMSVMI